jgi:hypothetical protein
MSVLEPDAMSRSAKLAVSSGLVEDGTTAEAAELRDGEIGP